ELTTATALNLPPLSSARPARSGAPGHTSSPQEEAMSTLTTSAEARLSSRVLERQTEESKASRPRINVGDAERLLSVLGGGALAVLGLPRGPLPGLGLAALGGGLLYRGLSGHCSTYQALGVNTAEPRGPATSIPAGRGVKVDLAMTINRPAADLFR